MGTTTLGTNEQRRSVEKEETGFGVEFKGGREVSTR